MNWSKITVQQFQDIHELASRNIEDIEKSVLAICILYNMTETQVDDMELTKFNELSREIAGLFNNKIPGNVRPYIKANNKRYFVNYKPSTLRHRQYVEVLHFSQDSIKNMHLIMASIVNPVRFGFFKGKNTAESHAEIAEDMLQCHLIDVYHSCVFFCKLLSNSMQAIQGYLEQEMKSKGMSQSAAGMTVESLKSVMAGFIPPSKLQDMKV